jgi:hypothetical protein
MKKILLTTIFALTASLSYAGSCCEAGGAKDKSKDAGKSGVVENMTIVAGSGCGGGSCGDKDSKTKLNTTDSSVAKSGCGGGSCGDKGSKAELNATDSLIAGNCGGGSCGDKDSKSKLNADASQFAGSGCGGGSCGDKSKGKSSNAAGSMLVA